MLLVILASYELMSIIQHTFEQDVTSVRYVRSMEQPDTKVDKKVFDINKIMESNNVGK